MDVLVQEEIICLLKRSKRTGMAMLFITHDLPLASHICDWIAVMDHGKILETGETERVLQNPESDKTKELLDSILRV